MIIFWFEGVGGGEVVRGVCHVVAVVEVVACSRLFVGVRDVGGCVVSDSLCGSH